MSSTPICSLSAYRQIVADLDRPQDEQIDNFIAHISEGHSWYKRLPLLPPGLPFYFYIDPFSGYDHEKKLGSDWRPVERTEDSARLHYTSMPTAKYRSRFGYLSYEVGYVSAPASPNGVAGHSHLPIFFTAEGGQYIPLEVAKLGSADITAPIHPLTARVWIWHQFLVVAKDDPNHPPLSWPVETGGDNTLQKIVSLCEQYDDESGDKHTRLVALIEPEQRRLQSEMRQAIERMLELVAL